MRKNEEDKQKIGLEKSLILNDVSLYEHATPNTCVWSLSTQNWIPDACVLMVCVNHKHLSTSNDIFLTNWRC